MSKEYRKLMGNTKITVYSKVDVSQIIKLCKKYGYEFDMLMQFSICKAASQFNEFYMLPVDKKMIRYREIAISSTICSKKGIINSCDVPFCTSLNEFISKYNNLRNMVYDTCYDHDIVDMMVINSAGADGYTDNEFIIEKKPLNNPYISWDKPKIKHFKSSVNILLNYYYNHFSDTIVNEYLHRLQTEINELENA